MMEVLTHRSAYLTTGRGQPWPWYWRQTDE